MKKLFLSLLAGLFISAASSQTMINPFLHPEPEPATAFIGFSTGIDNMVGILGPQLDIVVVKNLMLGCGVGLSSWGYKYAANVQFYPRSLYSFYFKTGYSQNSGLVDFETELELMSGKEEQVRMDLKPVGNIFFTAGKAWKIGKRNRIYLEVGYALPLVTDNYYSLYDNTIELSKTSAQVLQMMRPGGLVIAAGLNFAISNLYKVN